MNKEPTPRWLVTGAGGMLGQDLTAVLTERGIRHIAADRASLDVTDADAVGRVVRALGPEGVVLNAAGWTDVDGAEAHEAAATAINGTAVAALARACSSTGAVLVHVSTDYVFGGDGATLQALAEDTQPAPVNAYGRSKLVGEQAVLGLCPGSGYVLRTAWLYGRHGGNFVATMLGLAASHDSVTVVDDQVGQPTWTAALAERMVEVALRRPRPRVLHASAAGQTSWYGLARAAYELAGLDPDRIRPVSSDAFPRPAARPNRSVLGHDRWADAGLAPLDDWLAMLRGAAGAGVFAGAAG